MRRPQLRRLQDRHTERQRRLAWARAAAERAAPCVLDGAVPPPRASVTAAAYSVTVVDVATWVAGIPPGRAA